MWLSGCRSNIIEVIRSLLSWHSNSGRIQFVGHRRMNSWLTSFHHSIAYRFIGSIGLTHIATKCSCQSQGGGDCCRVSNFIAQLPTAWKQNGTHELRIPRSYPLTKLSVGQNLIGVSRNTSELTIEPKSPPGWDVPQQCHISSQRESFEQVRHYLFLLATSKLSNILSNIQRGLES